ncbi:MAG: DUF4158 domain-containing protein, partial [Prevotella sp.]|nr:DUF4158 domain-containing protein [Prevotella sp.]
MPRINILKDKDINSFDSPPLFSEEERNKYFELPDNDIQFRKIEIKIGYILQEGYFKSRQKFFLPNQYHKVDIDYVIKLCGIKRKVEIDDYYSRAVHNIHKQFILDRYGYNSFSKSKSLFEKEAQELVKSSSRPEEMFSDLLNFLVDRKIEIPRYYVFAETITKSLNSFEKELIDAVDNTLTTEQKEILDGFMYLPADDNLEISSKNPYLITQLKKAEQATSPSKIKESLKDFRYIKELYDKLSDFYASDLLSNELINYYAVWVVKAEHIQFDAIRDIRNKRLYIISFISYQYKMRQDYFMDAFLSAVQKFYNDAEKNTALSFMNQDLKYKKQEQLTKVKDIVCRFANLWKIVFSNPGYDSDKKLELIKEVFRNGNFNPQDNLLKELDELGTAVAKNLKDLLLYEELNKTHKKLMIKVTKILSALEFNPQSS